MNQSEAFEVFNEWLESQPQIDGGQLFLDITGLPIWWDRVGSEWSKAQRKLIRWAEGVVR